jgi:HPt (histidine-containing phosphotransfer) domain-containing protein
LDLLRQLEDVATVLEADDPIGIQHFAHRAKGTSGTYGLALISEQFARLEQAAGNHPREHLARLLGTIRQLIQAQIEMLPPGIASAGRDQKGDGND